MFPRRGSQLLLDRITRLRAGFTETPLLSLVDDRLDIVAKLEFCNPTGSAKDRSALWILEVVREAYLTHDAGDSVNPHSAFLRFPHLPGSRIISLPAYLGGGFDVAGIKWIASFPDNTQHGIPRASATLVLNDCRTGFPFACMESSVISATRTAASAVLGAESLTGEPSGSASSAPG